MSSRLLQLAAAFAFVMASGTALACPGKATTTDGSQGSGAPTTTEQRS